MKERDKLQQELEEVRRQLTALDDALAEKPEYGMGKGDPSITQWELDQAMHQRLEARAAAIQQALGRLNDGSYGRCERCGELIHPDRLAVLPDTKICIKCAQEK
ncbi:MAG: TraR/DksA family transcriptional regulator [Anaerolineales bacterium]